MNNSTLVENDDQTEAVVLPTVFPYNTTHTSDIQLEPKQIH